MYVCMCVLFLVYTFVRSESGCEFLFIGGKSFIHFFSLGGGVVVVIDKKNTLVMSVWA